MKYTIHTHVSQGSMEVTTCIYLFIYYFINLSHHFPLKTSLKNIHMTMVHSKNNYERIGSLKDKHTKHFTKFC